MSSDITPYARRQSSPRPPAWPADSLKERILANLRVHSLPDQIRDDSKALVDYVGSGHPLVAAMIEGADPRRCISALCLDDDLSLWPGTQPYKARVRIRDFLKHEHTVQSLLAERPTAIEAAATDAELGAFSLRDLRRQTRYSGTVYAGGIIHQQFGKIVVNLAGVRISGNPQPALHEHKSDRPIGKHTAVIDDGVLRVVDGRFTVDSLWSREVLSGVQNNHPWQASIRGTFSATRFVKKGTFTEVNGRRFAGPILVANRFDWVETSFTGLGADDSRPRFEFEVHDE